MINTKPLLTISLLISNRPDTVRKSIDSICPLLEAIPSELILTDTSKNPEIHALCHEYTDKVYEFDWVKDFSKARNFGLEKATGEWFMFLDDDEWFTDVQEFIDFFKSGEYKEYGYAHYLTRNFYDPECTQYGDCWVTRMFRRDDDIRYVGKVHEIFTPLRGKGKYLYPMTHHIGYIFLTEEKRQQHSNRNITLLLDELKENPTNIRFQTQLVLEYRFRADWEEEVAFCKKCLEEAEELPKSADCGHIGTFYAGLIEGLFYQKQYEESIVVCEQALSDERSTELAKALYHLRLAENFIMLENWQKAKEYADIYLEEYKELSQDEVLIREQSMALLIRYAFEEMNFEKAYAVLACCNLKAGSTQEIKKYYDRIKWNLNYTVFYEQMTKLMVEAMATLEFDSIFAQIIADACKKEEFKMLVCAEAQEWEQKDDVAFQKLVPIFAQVEDDYWFFWYMKMLDEDMRAGKYGMEAANEEKLLTISLLVSNRSDTIRRCLDSLYQIRKTVPSELILIDTSRNPEIHDILLEYTDQVYEFEWCKDFAKARNEGLKRAKGKWFMFLDDDEWFVDIKELIEFFRSGEYQEYERANYQVRNFYDPDYVQYADCWVSRMNRINEDSHFVGKVHEYMEPCTGKEKNIHAMAYHSGYIFTTEEDRTKHAERNITLLLDALQEEPDNLRWQTQLAQEYRSSVNWEALANYCKEQVEVGKNQKETAVQFEDPVLRNQFGTFYGGLVEGLVRIGEYDEAIRYGEEILSDKFLWEGASAQTMPLLKALILLSLAESYFELEEWKKATEYANAYLEQKEVIRSDEKVVQEQEKVLIVQHAFDPANVKKAYSILICDDLKQGSTKLLHEYYEKLEWNEIINYVLEKLPSYLVEVMSTLPYESIFSQIITDTFKREDFKIFMCREALRWEDNLERFSKLAYIYAQVESDFWFVWYMKIVDAAVRKDITLVEKISADDWEANTRTFVNVANEKQIGFVRKSLQAIYALSDWKLASVENIVIEKQIMDGPDDLGNLENYYVVLKKYAEIEPILQSTAQAASKIYEYIQLEAQDKLQALGKLKEAVDSCPDFAEGIGRFISHYSEFEKQRVAKQRKEMQQLRNQVLEQIKGMLAKGQDAEALQIIQQMKQMFPGDLEVVALGLELRLKTLER